MSTVRGTPSIQMYFVSILGALLVGASCAANHPAYLTTPQLVAQLQYPFEAHQVVTTDGYILTHHRIPFGRQGPARNVTRWPILIQHGLVGDSSGWVNTNSKRPADSLGFLLADMDFDVWLLNSRGNYYSRGHTRKGQFNPSYFDFSYHEIGVYDLPDTIDYVLHVTGFPRVVHIGHSQGNTAMWVMLSKMPEFNSKVALHIAYAPVAYHTHSRNPTYRMISWLERFGVLSMWPSRLFELPRNTLMTHFLVRVCGNWSPLRYICEAMYYWQMGYNPVELDKTELANIYGHYPSCSSVKQFTHFVQGVNKPNFAEFDYKSIANTQYYGTDTPPPYNLSRVEVPVYSFYGGRDSFCQVPDVDRLHSNLRSLKSKYFLENWAHYDFIHGISVRKLVYEPTIRILKENLT